MKTTYRNILLISLLSTAGITRAQQAVTSPAKPGITGPAADYDDYMLVELFGVIPKDSPVSRCGWGGGLNMFGRALNLGPRLNPDRLQVRFGGGFYVSSLMSKKINDVPLESPQTGNATVNVHSNIFGINGIARFSKPVTSRFTPYVDAFAGFRSFNTELKIRPNIRQADEESNSAQALPGLWQFNYGASLGFSAALCKTVRFYASGTVSYALKNEKTIAVKSARLESGTITTDEISVAKPFFMANVGFCFVVDPKSGHSGNCTERGTRSRSSRGGGSPAGGSSRVKVSTRSST
jgi:hypothetical protein